MRETRACCRGSGTVSELDCNISKEVQRDHAAPVGMIISTSSARGDCFRRPPGEIGRDYPKAVPAPVIYVVLCALHSIA